MDALDVKSGGRNAMSYDLVAADAWMQAPSAAMLRR
jgi:hypothetical protein